jgi:hypothetical protein
MTPETKHEIMIEDARLRKNDFRIIWWLDGNQRKVTSMDKKHFEDDTWLNELKKSIPPEASEEQEIKEMKGKIIKV